MPRGIVDYILTHEEAFKSKARLNSLYSDFSRLKTSNPEGYTANVSAWTSALARATKAGLLLDNTCGAGVMSFAAGKALEGSLECPGVGRPAALGTVVEDAVAKHEFMPLNEYMSAKTSVVRQKGWLHFQLPTAWEVAQWGLRQVGFSRNASLSEGEFVVMSNLEEVTQKFLSHLSSDPPSTASSRIHSLETFTQDYATLLSPSKDHPLTASDLRLLLTYLSRDKNIIAVSSSLSSTTTSVSHITIKLPTTATTSPEPITTNDETIAQLRTLEQTLTNQTTLLTNRIETLEQTARSAVSSTSSKVSKEEQSETQQNNASNSLSTQYKSRALTALRQKRLASTTLEKRQASLAQIERVLTSIDDAASQAETIAALQSSTAVLRDLNKQVGGAEDVESVMDALNESIADVEDVGKVIAEGSAGVVDEGEVDEEFEKLQREQQEKEEKIASEKAVAELPDVPRKEVGDPREEPVRGHQEERLLEKRLSQLSVEDGDQGTHGSIDSMVAEPARGSSG